MKLPSLSSLAQLPLSLPWSNPEPLNPHSLLPPSHASYPFHPIPISYLFDNAACCQWTGNFDGNGRTFPEEVLPTGEWVWDGIRYELPAKWGDRYDNVICQQQVVNITGVGYVKEFHMLYAGDWIDGETTERVTVGYEDGTSEEFAFSVKNWWNLHWLNEGVIKAPYHHLRSQTFYNLTQIHQFSSSLSTRAPAVSITLPSTMWSWNRLHLFSLSYTPALAPEQEEEIRDLIVRRARLTSKTLTEAPFAPLVEIAFASLARPVPGAKFPITSTQRVYLTSHHFKQHELVEIYRLAPGDEVRVLVPVLWVDEERDKSESRLPVELVLKDEKGRETGRWVTEVERRFDREVETPLWWDDSKFGIFIHWGIYSVPAWAPLGLYAAWYNWWLHNPADMRSEGWRYHKETYGTDLVYDDWIPEFTGSKFNGTQWIDLFQNAGAKYFVIVTKHHEGFALFDTRSTSHRSSVHLGPHRDFVRELMDAARQLKMRKGTYFSMPEWFNPDYQKYGIDRFPGGLSMHPFKAATWEEYTGRLPIDDYLWDLQLAQMRILAQEYKTEIMWCDIGGPNLTHVFAPEFYAQAKAEGRQVTMNNRCGSHASFDTPEFDRFSAIHTRKWETSEGIDPHTYGLNRRTKPEEYRSPDVIVRTLVDIVSKNGNYLLNVGPDAEGVIIDPMRERLLEVGRWLQHSGECIYNTTYSALGPQVGNVRFTTTPKSFCIISLEKPQGSTLIIPASRQIPILPKDTVHLLGASMKPIPWNIDHDGSLVLHLNATMVDKVKHAWAFRITYHGIS
ncbi:glycoside hydrolase [Dacryopinax primogenitus]|uniref:alpha-L-fucosidase n=1 Tax=Dacryopinax primogenitus (strain DJM 731) TaxID=1858805 RepID=M5FN89_DACPD|nr:glycoside hydrolase [Dacryopinax primogenitus]EJT97025.1 glycoside hydrolase [Dacryopinax primogenitus]